MYFDSFTDFLAMGNHGLYVWMAYGFFVLVLAWILIDLRLDRKSSLDKARRVWARERVSGTQNTMNRHSGEDS